MGKSRNILPVLVLFLGAAACQSSPPATATATDTAAFTATREPADPIVPSITATFRKPATPTKRSEATRDPDNLPFAVPDLHSAGPFMYLDSHPNYYGECETRESIPRILFELDGSGVQDVEIPDSDCGRFSPDMRWYAFLKRLPTDNKPENFDIGIALFVVNLVGETTQRIAELIPDDYEERQTRMVERYRDELRSTTDYPEDILNEVVDVRWAMMLVHGALSVLAWSPDSRYLAFPAMIDGDSTDVYLLDMDTGILQRKDSEYLNVFDIDWSPDSKWILFKNAHPVGSAPISTTQYWSVRAAPFGPVRSLDYYCGIFDWKSDTEFLGRDCFYGCGGDPPTGTDLFQINIATGTKRSIWQGDWYGYAFDGENGTIMMNAEDPCSGEDCDGASTGIYLGPVFGTKERVGNAPDRGYDFMLRKGSAHRFLGLSNPPYFPITFVEGIAEDGEREMLIRGENLRVSISADYRWMAITGDHGIRLFDEADRPVFLWEKAPVHKAAWSTNSRSVFFMTSDAVYRMDAEGFFIQKILDCPERICGSDAGLSLLPYMYLSSLPRLRAQAPAFANRTQGTSLWSKATFRDLPEPGLQEYTVTLPAYSEWRWDFSWCAKTEAGLADILEPFEIAFSIGGEPIGEDAFRIYDSAKGGRYCRTRATLLSGWQPGDKTGLEIRYTLGEAINDGTREYPAGEYRQIMHVMVEE